MSEEATFDEMGEDLFDALGVDATFTPAAGDPIPLKVDFKNDIALQPTGYETRSWQGEKTIEFVLDEIGREPNRGEKFEIDGTDYTVQSIVENSGRFCKVTVT
jgi:hypothetical protein